METPETRLHLVAVADLAPGTAPALHPVDRDGLDGLLDSLSPAAGPLTFRTFKDFRPERLAQALPAAAGLLRLRAKALELAAGQGTLDGLRDLLRATPDLARALDDALARPAAPAPRPAPAGGIFDLVDVEGAAPSTGLDALIGELLDSGSSVPPAALRTFAGKVEEALGGTLRAALRDPKLRELEAAWRGLRWLVRSVDFRAGCRMHVLPCGKADRAKAIRDVLLPFAADLRAEGSIPLFVFDAELDEEVVGVPAVAGWSGAAAPRGVAPAANRFQLRPAYGKDGDRVKDFAFEEAGEPLFGRASWIVGALAANAFARTGWAANFTGPSAAEGLEPVVALEKELKEPEARALGDAGAIALVRGTAPFAATGASLRTSLYGAQVGVYIERIVGHLDPGADPAAVAKTLAAGVELLGYPALSVSARPADDGRPAVSMTVKPAAAAPRGMPELEVEVPVPRF
ncbi:MAG TPA: hypothetical protein VF950_26165 [Planctomycetota bacterium]